MADCDPLIDSAFLGLVTGADVSDSDAVDALIIVVSTLIGEELGACVVPASASMKLRVVCAQYCSYVMDSGNGANAAAAVRAEQIGDYRIEYQSNNRADRFDLQLLRDMLQSINGASNYTATTMDEREEQYLHYADPEDTQALWAAVTT